MVMESVLGGSVEHQLSAFQVLQQVTYKKDLLQAGSTHSHLGVSSPHGTSAASDTEQHRMPLPLSAACPAWVEGFELALH